MLCQSIGVISIGFKVGILISDLEELLLDGSEQVEARLDLSLGVLGFYAGGDHGHEPTLGRHLVGVGHARDVDVASSAHCKNTKIKLMGISRQNNTIKLF